MKQLSNVEIAKMREMADFLETVTPQDFNLESWVEREHRDPTSAFFGLIKRDPGCGFAGCAMGWAAHSELFLGLRITNDGHNIAYKGFTGFDAAATLFGIGENQAFFLFSPKRYQDDAEPGHVAIRLRDFADRVSRQLARRQTPMLRVAA